MLFLFSDGSGTRNFKKVHAKKTCEIKFHEKNFFFTKIHFFTISKMAKKQFLNWGKSLKLPKMQFHEKIFDLTFFFAWTF